MVINLPLTISIHSAWIISLHSSRHIFDLFLAEDSAFKTHPQDTIAFEGFGTAAFNCTYDDDEYLIPPTIIWKLNETTLQPDNRSITIFSYGYTSFLQLYEPASSMHMANIRCSVQIEPGKDVDSQAAILRIMSG